MASARVKIWSVVVRPCGSPKGFLMLAPSLEDPCEDIVYVTEQYDTSVVSRTILAPLCRAGQLGRSANLGT